MYREKRERLLAQRAKVAQPAARPTMPLAGLLDARDRSDALGRRELLAALFIELDVRNGRVWRVQPQPDVAAELMEHLQQWWQGWFPNSEMRSVGVARAGRYSNRLDELRVALADATGRTAPPRRRAAS